MKLALLRSGTTEKPQENEDCGTGRRPWIIKSAGEPESYSYRMTRSASVAGLTERWGTIADSAILVATRASRA